MLRIIALASCSLLLTACADGVTIEAINAQNNAIYNARFEAMVEAEDGESIVAEASIATPEKSGKSSKAKAKVQAKAKTKRDSFETAKAETVSDEELDENRGTFSPEVLNSSVLEATSTENVTIGGVTGNNLISSNAFTNAQGVVSLIQNSGNNVIIQNSTIVNLTFE